MMDIDDELYNKIHRDFDGLNSSLNRDLEDDMIKELNSIRLFYRIFSRIKSSDSIIDKFKKKNYSNLKKMQDLIGFRIVVYFNDDVNLCINLLKDSFKYVDETVDKPDSATFKPSRINLIFRLPEQYCSLFSNIFKDYFIDNTFEVQIRTVFSEGWHEVEHDLRYKCQEDWCEYPDLGRVLNGLVATLETCDWSMLMLFDELTYRHYQKKNWVPMFKNKFRVKMINYNLDEEIKNYFDNNHEVVKKFLKFDRVQLLTRIIDNKINIPLNLNNLIYITNILFIHDDFIIKKTPQIIKEEIESIETAPI